MKNLEYDSGSLRQEFEEEFKKLCDNELNIFYKLIDVTGKVNLFLADVSNNDIGSKEYYTRIINARIRDHMVCATLLIGKGFIVDGITLIRSTLEDLWLIQNIYYNTNYFERWKKGGDVKPAELRGLKQISDRKKENKELYNILCNISHCNIKSLEHMSIFHPSINNIDSEGVISIVKEFELMILSFYGCYLQLLELFENIYSDNDTLLLIRENLENINIHIVDNI